jgi:hypothetical protein
LYRGGATFGTSAWSGAEVIRADGAPAALEAESTAEDDESRDAEPQGREPRRSGEKVCGGNGEHCGWRQALPLTIRLPAEERLSEFSTTGFVPAQVLVQRIDPLSDSVVSTFGAAGRLGFESSLGLVVDTKAAGIGDDLPERALVAELERPGCAATPRPCGEDGAGEEEREGRRDVKGGAEHGQGDCTVF